MQLRVQAQGNKASKLLTEKNLWGLRQREKLPASQESSLETHRVLECTQTHLLRNQHQNGPICLWVMGQVTESQPRARQAHSLLDLFPTYSARMQQCRLPSPGKYLRLHPFLRNRYVEAKKKYGPNERTEQSSRKNTAKP